MFCSLLATYRFFAERCADGSMIPFCATTQILATMLSSSVDRNGCERIIVWRGEMPMPNGFTGVGVFL